MGGKSSKGEGLVRAASFRKSQKNNLQRIERKLTRASKDIEKFKGTIEDNKYTKIKQNITEVIDDLEKINASVKDKHKELYQKILDRCNEELQKLDAKVTNSPSLSPVASPTPNSPQNRALSPVDSPLSERSNVQVKLVKIALDEEAKSPRSTLEGPNAEAPIEEIQRVDLEQQAVDTIDATRKKIEYLESEIHLYKKEPDEKLYGFIKESIHQLIATLDAMETYGNVQIKHERKLALQRAQECLKYLNDGAGIEEEPESSGEVHVQSRNERESLSKGGVYRPITFNLNINDKLNEELHNVIHKRMEEATKDVEKPVQEKLLKTDGANRSTDDSFENFDNPDSEEEFDFICDDDKDKSKSTPVLVTSF